MTCDEVERVWDKIWQILFTTITTTYTIVSCVIHASQRLCLCLLVSSSSLGSLPWDTNELCMLILDGIFLRDFLSWFTHICLFSYHHFRTVPVALHFKSVALWVFLKFTFALASPNTSRDASAVLCSIWGVPRESAVYCLTFSGGLVNFTPLVLSLVISMVRYCAPAQSCVFSIITEHLEMNSLWLLLGVTLSRPTCWARSWWMMVVEDLSDLGHSQELQFVSVDNLDSPERLLL